MTGVFAVLDRGLTRLNEPAIRRVVLIAACVALAGGLVWAVASNPTLVTQADWRPLALVIAVCVPVGLALNASEFALTGRLIGRTIPFRTAVEVAVVGAAANMLPLPGSTAVRIAQLKASGSTLGSGVRATLVIALMWLGIAACYAGVAMVLVGDYRVAAGFAVPGFAVLGATLWLTVRAGWPTQPLTWLVLNKVALVTVHSARMYLCLLALGAGAGFAQAAGLAVTGVLGSMVSVVPAGLGVREAAAVALAPVLGLGMGAAFVATALNRLLGLGLLVPTAAALAWLRAPATRKTA